MPMGYRCIEEKILQRYGADINRANMANWMIKLLGPMTPLLDLITDNQKTHDYLQDDETRIQVLKEPVKKPPLINGCG